MSRSSVHRWAFVVLMLAGPAALSVRMDGSITAVRLTRMRPLHRPAVGWSAWLC
jgi:hypothetical protein